MALVAGLFVAEEDAGIWNGGACGVSDGAADRAADDLRGSDGGDEQNGEKRGGETPWPGDAGAEESA